MLLSSLLNMRMDMIMKMNSLTTKNVTVHNSGISAEPMSRIPANNQSSRDVLNPTDKSITNQANFESSASLAKSLKMLFSSNLENAVLENSTGLMPIPGL